MHMPTGCERREQKGRVANVAAHVKYAVGRPDRPSEERFLGACVWLSPVPKDGVTSALAEIKDEVTTRHKAHRGSQLAKRGIEFGQHPSQRVPAAR